MTDSTHLKAHRTAASLAQKGGKSAASGGPREALLTLLTEGPAQRHR